jgi:hypothetical protein
MKRPYLFVLTGIAILALVAGAWKAADQQRTLQRLAQQIEHAKRELALQKRATESTQHELALADRQLSQLPTGSAANTSTPGGETEVARLLSRVHRMEAVFARHPEQRTPEMRSLSEAAWVRVARAANLDTDRGVREALAQVRWAAKMDFLGAVVRALGPYARAHDDALPHNLAELAPHLPPAIDPAALSRYELLPFDPPLNRANWSIRERAPIDAEFDHRHTVDAGRNFHMSFAPLAWDPELAERHDRARSAYASARGGSGLRGTNIAPLLPYFDPPLPPEVVTRLLSAPWVGELRRRTPSRD